MKWIDKIKQFNNNFYMIPKNFDYFYETSCYKNNNSIFIEKFIKTNKLSNKQNYNEFKKYIDCSKNKYVVSFYNLSKTTLLIIPIPKKNKNFSTLNNFCKFSSKTQQYFFWKKVAFEINKFKKNNDKIFISTHGLGVPYFHLRLESHPKYYISDLINC